ncbi:MAG: type II toxin-antitoxin system RelE/ParE family toxin [Acidobacteria bacterium]|nr:type II toxin-antitoxin system RelE/ParE family toxin [Acidobacteriota bacterium]
MRIVITESAADDLAEGHIFYDRQLPGVGNYFRASILADIRSLIVFHSLHEIHFGIYFRKIASKFPYAIYYTVDGSEIRIFADTRRDPSQIRRRFETD